MPKLNRQEEVSHLHSRESGEIGRRTRLRIWRSNPWGFKSPLSHQFLRKTAPESDSMSQQNPVEQPKLKLAQADTYRDGYANSVQVRMSFWDFLLVFGTMTQETPDEVTI